MPSHILPIDARGIDRTYGDRRILTGVDIAVPPGSRTGLIGENGVGKSMLLRILAGVEQPDAGTVTRPLRTGILWQEAPVDERAAVGELIDGYTRELVGILKEFEDAAAGLDETLGSQRRYEAALAAADSAEVWTLDARRAQVLEELGVAGVVSTRAGGAAQPARLVGELSGGERSRVALAGLLLSRPDALLLDEPTNHLDDRAVEYLVGQLKNWKGPVLFASHDRAFLDEVATELVDLDPDRSRTATRYGGTFTDYLAEKSRERARWEQQHRAEQDELARLDQVASTTARTVAAGRGPTDNDKFIHAFKGARVQSAVSRRVKDAERRRDVLVESQVRKPPAVLRFAGIPGSRHAAAPLLDQRERGPLVEVRDVDIPGRLTLDRLTIAANDRLLITGPNGAGKSTLLSVLAGELAADSVTRTKGATSRWAPSGCRASAAQDQSMTRRSIVFAVLTLGYLAIVAIITLGSSLGRTGLTLSDYDVLSTSTWLDPDTWTRRLTVEFFANIGLFVPLGFLLRLALPRARWVGAFLIGGSISVAIEVLQVWGPRVSDPRDVLANSLGALVGAVVAAILSAVASSARARGSRSSGRRSSARRSSVTRSSVSSSQVSSSRAEISQAEISQAEISQAEISQAEISQVSRPTSRPRVG